MNEEDEERIAARVLDRIRGGPMERMTTLAKEEHVDLPTFMAMVAEYIATGHKIDSFTEIPSIQQFWADYELMTGVIVPPHRRDQDPIECCA